MGPEEDGLRIAFAGSGPYAVGAFSALLESRHRVVALIQNGRRVRGLKRRAVPWVSGLLMPATTTPGLAKRSGLPIFYIDCMDDAELSPLAALKPDLLLVAGFGIILNKTLLKLPRMGCVNCHASLLPKHRGPNPFRAVLLHNERESGVTFHVMTEGIDEGDILAQFTFPLSEADTGETVYRKATLTLQEHVASVVDRIAREGLGGVPQAPEAATYDKQIPEEELFIRWEQPARDIHRMIRACYPFSPARFSRGPETVFVWAAEVEAAASPAPPGTVVAAAPAVCVATGQGTLRITRACTKNRLHWPWPGFLNRPRPGEMLR